MEFGYGTKFPAKYQKALYICDWTFGTMYAIHITPDGSTYKGEKEEFLSRTPLPLTDVTVGHDGALYFTIGGRGTQSELYRVTYVGEESTEPADLHDAEFATDRASRHQLEEYHRPGIVETLRGEKGEAFHKSIVNAVNSDDRNLRFAARLAVERMLSDISGVGGPPTIEPNLSPIAIIESAVALAHVGSSSGRDHLLNQRLLPINFSQLTESQQLDYLRALSLVFIRLGAPDDATRQKFVDKLDPLYPSKSHKVNQELCQMLVYLQSPTVVEKTIGLLKEPSGVVEEDLGAVLSRNAGYGGAIKAMLANQPDKPRVAYALALREAKVGWTIESRKAYFEFLDQAKVDDGEFLAVGLGKAALGQALVQRHLAALIAVDGHARTRFLALDAAPAGLAHARARPAPDPLAGFGRAVIVAQFMQFHVASPLPDAAPSDGSGRTRRLPM